MNQKSILLLLAVWIPSGAALSAPMKMEAESFPLSDVQLLDSPFRQAMERNAKYLLDIEPDRLLHNTRKYCGLAPKGELYGGWETQGIAGHTLGHYLTALSLQYAATGDRRFRQRIDYIVAELAECQKAYGDGYVGALPPLELKTMRGFRDGIVDVSSAFNFKGGAWVPWYTQHKVLAGLVDAWALAGSAEARQVALRLADWTDDLTKGLSEDQLQKMLQVEHGGMLETLAQIYALTGEERYLDVSRRFYHRSILDPLLAGRDDLNGKHANTQIPKVIGEARIYEVAGDEKGRSIAEFFWKTVTQKRSWVIGGNSDREHFFPPGRAHEHLGPAAAESCNTYNMLKLTGHLFRWQPSVEAGDYYERALYNHILASQEPNHGMFAYFISLKPGHFKTYSKPYDAFWCCVGSGMENHTKYGESIYFHAPGKLYINLFIPSKLTWKSEGLILEQRTLYPNEELTEFAVQAAPEKPVSFLLRCPSWAAGPLSIQLNGRPLQVPSQPGRFAEIARVWKTGDRLSVRIPMGLRVEKLENNDRKIAFLYGPLVLAGDLGAVADSKSFPYAKDQGENFRVPTAEPPVLVADAAANWTSLLKRVPGSEPVFRSEGIGKPQDVTLRPFHGLFYQRYNVYWDILPEQEWKKREAELLAEQERRKREEARIVDEINFGEQQSEVDHRLVSERSKTGDFRDRKWRDAADGGFFEFRMKVDGAVSQLLRCTYWGDDDNREFLILVDGRVLAEQKLDRSKRGQFFDLEYPIPQDWMAGKHTVTVRFQPKVKSIAGGVFGAAILRAEK